LKKNKLLLIALFIGFTMQTKGQYPAKVTRNVAASIVSAVSINVDQRMSFRDVIAASPKAAKLKLSASEGDLEFNNQTVISKINGNNNIHVAAIFSVQSEPNTNFTVLLPDSPIEMTTTATGSNTTLTVTNFTLNFDSTNVDSDLGQQLSNDNTNKFTIGAALNIEDSQTIGNYTGKYAIAIDYE
jgi:hypothetical protein